MKKFNIGDKPRKEWDRNQLPKSQQSIKSAANDAEDRHSKALGAKKHAGSGAFNQGGDFSLEDFTFDSKTTTGKRLSLTGEEMSRVCKDASGQGKYPALAIEFGQTTQHVPDKWVAVPLYAFQELLRSTHAG